MIEAPQIEKIWEPNKGKQATFLSLPDSIFEKFYGGQAGGGKTEVLLMYPLVREWTNSPRYQCLFIRRTYDELEKSVIPRSKQGMILADGTEIPSFYDFGAEYNEQKHRWKFPSGATITFGHAEEEEDVRKYDTAEFQTIIFDELTSFTEFQYKFLAFSRCRSVIPGVPAVVLSGSNPGNIGHKWVRERFIEPCRTGGKIIAERINDPTAPEGYRLIKRIFIQATLADNPKLINNDPMYRVRLEMLPEADKRAKLYGDWWTFSGQVFSEFRTEPFADEPPIANHIINHPYIPGNKVVIYKEYVAEQKSVKTWATEIANICLSEGITPVVVLDPSAWQNRGQGLIADQFSDAWKEVTNKRPLLEKADNNRLSGKMLIHDYLRWKTLPKYIKVENEEYNNEKALWILRNNGIEAHKAYLSKFSPQSDIIPEDLPKLQILNDCKILNKTIPLCVYDEKDVEDVKEFKGDDPYDCLRYFLKKCETYKNLEDMPHILAIDWGYQAMTFAIWGTSSITLRNSQLSKHPNMEQRLTEREWNNLYRRMEVLESQKKNIKYINFRRGVRRHARLA